MQLLWTIARLLVTRVSLIYLVDKFLFLFLVYLNKMITLGESKVLFLFSGVKQGNERERLVQNFLVLTQGFRSFPTVFSRAKWRNFALMECLWVIKPMFVDFCSIASWYCSGWWVWDLRTLTHFQGREMSPGLFQDFMDGYIKF